MDLGKIILDWLKSLLGLNLLLDAIAANKPIPAQAILNVVFSSITLLLAILVLYKTLYVFIGLFGKSRTYPDAPKDKKYAFIVPARNEKLVIANLIDSVRDLDYPQELVDVIVVADNCDEDDIGNDKFNN